MCELILGSNWGKLRHSGQPASERFNSLRKGCFSWFHHSGSTHGTMSRIPVVGGFASARSAPFWHRWPEAKGSSSYRACHAGVDVKGNPLRNPVSNSIAARTSVPGWSACGGRRSPLLAEIANLVRGWVSGVVFVRFGGFAVNVVSAHNDTCIEDQALSFCVSECSSTVIPFHIVLLRAFAVRWAGPRTPERPERHASARGRALVACCIKY